MFYVDDTSTAASVAEADAIDTILPIDKGIIHRVEIQFPPGSAALCHVQIYLHGEQIYPTNLGSSFASDDETITFRDFRDVRKGPLQLLIRRWNDDTTYAHAVAVRVGILPKFVILPAFATEGIIMALRSLFPRRAQK